MVGRNCRRLRQRAGLTREELAERLHVTRHGKSNLSPLPDTVCGHGALRPGRDRLAGHRAYPETLSGPSAHRVVSDSLPGLAYMLTAPPLGVLAAGCLIPAFTSLWADIRVRSVRARHVLLFLALNRR